MTSRAKKLVDLVKQSDRSAERKVLKESTSK